MIRLSSARFIRRHLFGATIESTEGPEAAITFEDCYLTGAKFLRSFANARFTHCDLSGANLSGASLVGAKFSESRLIATDFSGAAGRNVSFAGADLSGAIMVETNLAGSSIDETVNVAGGRPEQNGGTVSRRTGAVARRRSH